MQRCYINKKKYPAYYGIVTICDEWLVFQNFAKWYDENKYECEGRLHVDKDILHPGNKVYSPENCILLPQRINELFFVNSRGTSNLPQGIREAATGYSASFQGKHLGTYKTLKERRLLLAEQLLVFLHGNMEINQFIRTRTFQTLRNEPRQSLNTKRTKIK